MAQPLAGRTAIVTGASRGIGAEIARQLIAAGARVALAARNRTAIEKLAATLGPSALALECDVTDQQSVAAAAARLRQVFGGAPDIIVNNAGLFRVAPVDKMEPADFLASVTTNLFGPFLLMHEFVGEMKARGSGHIISIGSMGDRQIFPENAAYSAGKFGLRAMQEVARLELRGTGVRVSVISPGSVDTELWDKIDTESGQSGFPTRNEMMSPDAVGRAVIFAVTQPATVNIDELRLSRA